MYKNQLFSITTKNSVKLKEFAKSKNITMSKVINLLIDSYCSFDKKLDDEFMKSIEKINISSCENSNEKFKTLQIKLSQKEYEALKKFAENECLSSVARYVKYLISLKIYKDNSPANSELNELNKAKNELVAVGRNLNQLVKNLYQTNQELNIERLNNLLSQIESKQNALSFKISHFVNINKKKF